MGRKAMTRYSANGIGKLFGVSDGIIEVAIQ
jgi:hypothetical protein